MLRTPSNSVVRIVALIARESFGFGDASPTGAVRSIRARCWVCRIVARAVRGRRSSRGTRCADRQSSSATCRRPTGPPDSTLTSIRPLPPDEALRIHALQSARDHRQPRADALSASTCTTSCRRKSDFLLNVHAAHDAAPDACSRKSSRSRRIALRRVETDEATGNRIATFSARGAGGRRRTTQALVDIAHRIVDPDDVVAEAPSELPVSALRFLYPSRYCQADLVQQQAWDLFGTASARICAGASPCATGCAPTSSSSIGTSH